MVHADLPLVVCKGCHRSAPGTFGLLAISLSKAKAGLTESVEQLGFATRSTLSRPLKVFHSSSGIFFWMRQSKVIAGDARMLDRQSYEDDAGAAVKSSAKRKRFPVVKGLGWYEMLRRLLQSDKISGDAGPWWWKVLYE